MSIDLNHIWEELSVPLKSFIKKRIDNDTDADDILQDVFLKIHNSIGDLRDEDKIHAWVYRITQNAIIDYYRRSGKSIELPLVSEDVTKLSPYNCVK